MQLLTNETEKYLLALRSLLAAAALDKEHSKVHSQAIRFKLALDKDLASLDPKVAEIIKSEFTLLPESASLTQFNNDYLSKHKDCARRTLSGLSVRKLLAHDLAPSADADVVNVLKIEGVTTEEAVEGLELLQRWKSGEVEAFRKAAAAKWPKATVFAASS
jgi:N-alpha-acetyltransferase 15/16, NatA auxiliary subunit